MHAKPLSDSHSSTCWRTLSGNQKAFYIMQLISPFIRKVWLRLFTAFTLLTWLPFVFGQTILVTGGCGYIGSHTCVELLEAGHDVIILDNGSNSSESTLLGIRNITKREPVFIKGDIQDQILLDNLFSKHDIDAVMHFAGLKAVGESTTKPLDYYSNNVSGTLTLLHAMKKAKISTLVFSSSATVYCVPETLPIKENAPCNPANPYGQTKRMIEVILEDLSQSDSHWDIAVLRYFNPAGAHESGLIGESPIGIPNNLMPYVSQVATRQRPHLTVFGNDYHTPDGTGVRDYIHVVDLAQGHIKALDFIQNKSGIHTWNLGTGRGYSVLEVVKSYEKSSEQPIPYKMQARRPGDIAESRADPTKANQELGWKATRTLDDMTRDAWKWQQRYDQATRAEASADIKKTTSI